MRARERKTETGSVKRGYSLRESERKIKRDGNNDIRVRERERGRQRGRGSKV